VTFEIVSLVPSRASGDDALRPGERVTVTYTGGDERFVHDRHRYLVDASGSVPDALSSGVQSADECPDAASGVGTYRADGTRIDTGLYTADGIAPYLLPAGIALAVIATFVVAVAILARRRRPRLTIDGRPIRPGGSDHPAPPDGDGGGASPTAGPPADRMAQAPSDP
jgi:hypothetical protein